MLRFSATETEFFQPPCEGGERRSRLSRFIGDLSGLVRGVKLGFCSCFALSLLHEPSDLQKMMVKV